MTRSPLQRLVPTTYRPVLTHPAMRRLLVAFGVSDVGDALGGLPVAWLAINVAGPHDAGLLTGAAVAAYTLPGIAGAALFSRVMRRLPPTHLLVTDSLVRAVLLGCVPVTWSLGWLSPLVYLCLLGGSSLTHAWGEAGKFTMILELFPEEHRLAANALVNTLSSAAIVIGPSLAGVLVASIGPAWVIGINAASFGFLAIRILHLTRGGRSVLSTAAPDEQKNRRSGIAFLRAHPELAALIALTWAFSFIYGPTTIAMPLYVKVTLHQSASLLGLYGTLFGLGAVLGGLAVGSLRKLPLSPTIIGLIFAWGVAILPFGFILPIGFTLACRGLGGLLWGPMPALSFTLFQRKTPAQVLPSVLAARRAVTLTAVPLGAALGGPIVDSIGPPRTFFDSGLATIAVAGCASIVWGIRRRLAVSSRRC